MKDKSYKLYKFINPDIKVGDTVKLTDGSALSLLNDSENKYYIVDSYPNITGSHDILKNINAQVVETNHYIIITGGVSDSYYLQDIIVQIGKAKFRTCSKLVKKVPKPLPIIKIFGWNGMYTMYCALGDQVFDRNLDHAVANISNLFSHLPIFSTKEDAEEYWEQNITEG